MWRCFSFHSIWGWNSIANPKGFVENSTDGQAKVAHMLSTKSDRHCEWTSSISRSSISMQEMNFPSKELKHETSFTINRYGHSNGITSMLKTK